MRAVYGRNHFFVDGSDGVNAQFSRAVVLNHNLARLAHAVMTHVVVGCALCKALAVDVYALPCGGRSVAHKDEIGNALLRRAKHLQVSARAIAKKLARTISQRQLAAGLDDCHLPVCYAQRIGRLGDILGLVSDHFP